MRSRFLTDKRTSPDKAITYEIGSNRCPQRGRPVSLVPVASGQAFPSTVVPGHVDARMPDRLCGHAAMLLISGQEVAKQTLSTFQEIAFYEGAGSRIRTDDLLITNQLLYQ